MADAAPDASYWSRDAAALATVLGSGVGGLTSDRAATQLAGRRAQQCRGCAAPERPAPSAAAVRKPARPDPGLRRRHLAGPSAMGRCGDHPRHRAGQFASQLLSGIPGLDGGRGTEETPRADGTRAARRGRTGSAGDADRARRRDPSVGGQPDPCRWNRHRGAGLPCQRSQHDG